MSVKLENMDCVKTHSQETGVNMEHKNIVATIFLKNGEAVKSAEDLTVIDDVIQPQQMHHI